LRWGERVTNGADCFRDGSILPLNGGINLKDLIKKTQKLTEKGALKALGKMIIRDNQHVNLINAKILLQLCIIHKFQRAKVQKLI